jgi:hypothetical protein
MGWTSKAAQLALATALLTAGAARAAEPAPRKYRAVGRGEVPTLVFGAVKDWAKGLREVQALTEFIHDTGAWSPRFKTAAGMAGAAIGYFEGGKGSARFGAWDLSLDTSGQALARAVRCGNGRLLLLGVGRPDQGWSAEAALGLRDGRFLNESVTLAYKIRY